MSLTRVNKVLDKLKDGKIVFGVSIWSGSPQIMEIVGNHPYDFVWIDTEQSSNASFETVENMIRAANAVDLTPFVRVYKNDETLIYKMIGIGAKGVIVPHINTAEDANQAIEAANYPPDGKRGACPLIRQYNYGPDLNKLSQEWPSFIRKSNEETMVIALIEENEAINNLDEILETGIDAILPGGFDLSHTLGIPEASGNFAHPKLVNIMEEIIAKARDHDVHVLGSLMQFLREDRNEGEAVEAWSKKGINMFYVGIDYQIFNRALGKIAQQLTKFSS